MGWPETPSHPHRFDKTYPDHPTVWLPAETAPGPEASNIRNYRSCSYCGSIHPLDLLELSKKETFAAYNLPFEEVTKLPHLEMADMKYGHPHKIYVTTKIRVFPDHDFVRSTSWEKGVRTLTYGKGVIPFIKFYTKHLDEPEAPEEDFLALSRLIEHGTGFTFTRDERGLLWGYGCNKIEPPRN